MEIQMRAFGRHYLILKNWEDAEKHVDLLEREDIELLDISEIENGRVRIYY